MYTAPLTHSAMARFEHGVPVSLSLDCSVSGAGPLCTILGLVSFAQYSAGLSSIIEQ